MECIHDVAQIVLADRAERGEHVERARVGGKVGRASVERDRTGTGRCVGAVHQVLECGLVLSIHLSFPSRGAKKHGKAHLALAEVTPSRHAGTFAMR
jgi:hypothetical protein